MAGKKITTADLSGNMDVFSDLVSDTSTKTISGNSSSNSEEKSEPEKDVHLTMLVKESTRKAWKQFFIDHDLNTTQGIEIAMLHLLNDVQSGKYKLNKGGLREVQSLDD